MVIDLSLFNQVLRTDSIVLEGGVHADILRLDELHPTISGNKWFKLKYNLLAANEQNATAVLSFGGAYSNHLHALAYAGKIMQFKTIGIVRGEEVENCTLEDCNHWGMELHFVSRVEYRQKSSKTFLKYLKTKFPHAYIVPEGGDNEMGKNGCKEILDKIDVTNYATLCCSIGTGTTIRGLAHSFKGSILGFTSLKKATDLKENLENDIPSFRYIDNYHFGGFGKTNEELMKYMYDFFERYRIPLDKIYTAKMLYGIEREIKEGRINSNNRLLIIHTGGLQGNR